MGQRIEQSDFRLGKSHKALGIQVGRADTQAEDCPHKDSALTH